MVLAPLAVLVVYWLVASVVIALDPFDVYGWGRLVAADPRNTTDDNRYLLDAVAKDPAIDLLMVGSSTAAPYSPADLQRAYPDARHPYNLSYDAARPADRKVVMNAIVDRSKAKRLVVWLDWFYGLPQQAQDPSFPSYMYDRSRYNDLRMVNETAFGASLRMLRGGSPFDDFPRRLARRSAQFAKAYAKFQSPAALRTLASKVKMYRPIIDRAGVKSCASLASFNSGLLEPLRKWVASGRPADIVIPAYSPAFYYNRGDPASGLKLADQLMLRRCAVLETANLPGVRVIALDADAQLTGDLRNYQDTGHLFGARPLGTALEHIARGDLVLTPGNVDAYLAGLRRSVVGYQVPAAPGRQLNPR